MTKLEEEVNKILGEVFDYGVQCEKKQNFKGVRSFAEKQVKKIVKLITK